MTEPALATRRGARLRCLTAAVVAAALIVGAGTPAGAGNGRHLVKVVNKVDGSHRVKTDLQVTRIRSSHVAPQNGALALASCTDCRTVAVAVQVALVSGDASTVVPVNESVALNVECLRCATAAFAFQIVRSTPAPISLSEDAEEAIEDLEVRIEEVAQSDLDFDSMKHELNAIDDELERLIDAEIARAGQPAGGHDDEDSHTED